LGQYDKNQSYTDIFRIGPIPVSPITARSESARRFDNRKEKSREMSVVCWCWKWRDADQTEIKKTLKMCILYFRTRFLYPSILCTECWKFFWIVHSGLPLRFLQHLFRTLKKKPTSRNPSVLSLRTLKNKHTSRAPSVLLCRTLKKKPTSRDLSMLSFGTLIKILLLSCVKLVLITVDLFLCLKASLTLIHWPNESKEENKSTGLKGSTVHIQLNTYQHIINRGKYWCPGRVGWSCWPNGIHLVKNPQ
jgi:hypothetical protein